MKTSVTPFTRKIGKLCLTAVFLAIGMTGLSAQNAPGMDISLLKAGLTQNEEKAPFERNQTLCDIHAILGWVTVASGLATGILTPERAGTPVHATMGYTTAALSAATMGFGFAAHYGEIGPEFKWSVANTHALMGAVGGTMMIIAPFVAPTDAHKILGEGGALLMGASVVWAYVY